MNSSHLRTALTALALASAITTSPAQLQPQAGKQPLDSVVAVVADAQGLPFVPPDQRPFFGTFWTVRSSIPCITAPLPCPPLDPDTPVYAIGDPAVGGQFLVDQTGGQSISPQSQYSRRALSTTAPAAILQAQVDELQNFITQTQAGQTDSELRSSERMRSLNGPPPPPAGGGTNGGQVGVSFSAYQYTTNDLWLEIITVTNSTGVFVVHPPAAEATTGIYDLFMTTNLSADVPGLNLTNWLWLFRTGPGETNLLVPDLMADTAFFMLARTNDADWDGMSDAYEHLASHTSPTNADSPIITSQPLSQDVYSGDTVTISVAAEGPQPLAYQWLLNGTNLAGATRAWLNIPVVQMPQAGDYSVRVTSSAGLSVLSSNATLTVEYRTYWPMVLLTGARQDYTFRNGVTYYIYTGVQLYGTTTIEGGAVIKFNWYPTNATLSVMGTLVCKTEDPYLPAVLTSISDNTIGDSLAPGWPFTADNGCPYLDLTHAQDPQPCLRNLRIRYADQGVAAPASPRRLDIWDCQFFECNYAVVAGQDATDAFHNVLFADCGAVVAAATNYASIEGEHVTADVGDFWVAGAPGQIRLTNSIVAGNLAEGPVLITDHTALNAAPSTFQAVGSADYYLSSTSPYRRAGSAAVSGTLLAEFQHCSTQPPIALPMYSQWSGDVTLRSQAERYTNGAPDYGYYYPALDYTVAWLANRGTITVLPGTAIGFREDFAYDPDLGQGEWTLWGFDEREGSSFVSHGTPTRPNTFVDVQWVQEQFSGGACLALFVPDFWPSDQNGPAPVLDFRFSNFYPTPGWYHVWAGYDDFNSYLYSPDSLVDWTLRDCNLHGGRITLGRPDDGSWYGAPVDWLYGTCAVSWNNNLFDQVAIILDPTFHQLGWDDLGLNCDLSFQAHNNLFRGGEWFRLEPIPASAGNWVLKDNLFDGVDFVQDTNAPLDFNYNAYWPLSGAALQWQASTYPWLYPWYAPNAGQLLTATNGGGGNEQLLGSAPAYQTGPFGDYYLPPTSPLFGSGSRTPADAALYHYTTRIDQKKEGEENSGHMVNIGLHYVAATNCVPKDSDGDGIPDYAENASGTGVVGADETDWRTQYTAAGVFDPTNSVYDDIDLSGNGLVGRIKKALGMQPFDTGNPLALSQVLTGEEPDFATFEVPVNYDAVTGSGALHLNMNGVPVTLAECTRATNGNCLLSFNVAFDPAGLHYLSAGFRLGTEPGTAHPVTTAGGVIHPFCSSNSVQLYVNASMFDAAGAFLDAKLFVQEADYTIDLYNPLTTPRTWILSITNSTSNGMIQEDWGVTNADGTPFTGTTFEAVFTATPSGASSGGSAPSGKSSKIFTRVAGALSESGPNFDVAYMYTPTNTFLESAFGNINGIRGAVWLGMQGVVDALLTPVTADGGSANNYDSSFNRYTSRDFDGQPGIPGYVTSRADITDKLLPDLTNGLTRQFYCYAHGTSNALSSWDGTVSLSAGEVAGALGNSYTKTNLITQKPCRFVFLDGCATASTMDWSRAFGIYPLNGAPRDKVGPQAYVGWAKDHAAFMNGTAENDYTASLNYAKAYTQTLYNFYSMWMRKYTLKECIDNASNYGRFGAVQFPIQGNERMRVYGQNYNYSPTNVLTSRIYLIGYPGLRVDGVDHRLDNDKTYAAFGN